MRASLPFFFLLTLLCGLVAVCVAGDQTRQISSSRFDSVSGIVLPEDVGLAVSDPAAWERRHRESARDRDRNRNRNEDATCYTMQSYRVKRQSQDSDAVEPAGYSTCQRASKYGVKTAGESGTASSR
jgi:hypothetical protein